MLNCGHAVVRRLVADSLAHWASDFRIDGFAFVNAEALTHGAAPLMSPRIKAAACLCQQLDRFTFALGFILP